MRVLVTRGPDDAAPLVASLTERGHKALVAPLFTIEPLPHGEGELWAALDGVQALLFTSANGVRAFAAQSAGRALPVYAVGDATAAAARAAGFARVESAGGDVDALADLVAKRLVPADGPLFHAAASVVAGDLQGQLAARGFALRRLVLYEARPVNALAPEARAALASGAIDAVLFFSPRSGGGFVRLVEEAGLAATCRGLHAICLSRAVAAEVERLDWAGVSVADRPTTEALLTALDALDSMSREAGRPEAEQTRRMMVDDKNEETAGEASQSAGPPEQPAAAPASGGEAPSASAAPGQPEAPALAVIGAFGGIRPMANKLGIAVSTVQGWRERAAIPQGRHDQILAAARENGIALDEALLRASDKGPAPAGKGEEERKPQPAVRSAVPSSPRPDKPAGASPPPGSSAPRPAPPSQPPPRRGGGLLVGFLLGVIVFAAGAAGAIFTQSYWQPLLGLSADDGSAREAVQQRLSAVDTSLQSLEDRVAELSAAPAPAADDSATIDKLTTTVDSLGKRLDSLESATGGGGDTGQMLERLSAEDAKIASRVTDIESRIAALEQAETQLRHGLQEAQEANRQARAAAGGGSALALAIAQLRDALRGSAPFTDELAQLESLTSDDPQLAGLLSPLKSYAADGTPNLEELRRGFDEAARDAVAAGQAGSDQGWLGSVLRSVSKVVSIRPVGEVEGDDPGAIIARAEARLDAGDLAAAVAEVEKLQGPAAAAISDWRARAEARLAVERAVSALSAHAISRLGPTSG